MDVNERRQKYFVNGVGDTLEKLNSLPRFISRQNMGKLLCYNELFKMTENVLGSILECGVYYGNGFMTYANIAAALEPYNYQCKVVGFDTFEGDVGLTSEDRVNPLVKRHEGDYNAEGSYTDLREAIEIYDGDRPLNHMEKLELVDGDLTQTAPKYVEDNPSLTVRVLHLSVNIYQPTKAALENFYPLMPKGSVVAIHGINHSASGATRAIKEVVGDINNLELKVFDYYPNITYFVV
ncbi:MAG: hypothetical protein BA863_18560 [Desulfovibrio sp. S3730MH75]|nr:MAG: hypothetical protein BA863_18560 [Desulfovibrio sp. S3730MH75]